MINNTLQLSIYNSYLPHDLISISVRWDILFKDFILDVLQFFIILDIELIPDYLTSDVHTSVFGPYLCAVEGGLFGPLEHALGINW